MVLVHAGTAYTSAQINTRVVVALLPKSVGETKSSVGAAAIARISLVLGMQAPPTVCNTAAIFAGCDCWIVVLVKMFYQVIVPGSHVLKTIIAHNSLLCWRHVAESCFHFSQGFFIGPRFLEYPVAHVAFKSCSGHYFWFTLRHCILHKYHLAVQSVFGYRA